LHQNLIPFIRDTRKLQKRHYRTVSSYPLGTGSRSLGISRIHSGNRWHKLPM